MKIVVLAPANAIHTQRWVNEMARRSHEVTLITSHLALSGYDAKVELIQLPIPAPWGYYLNVWSLRRYLKTLQPDLLHVHYGSGYGTLARLAAFHPYLLSVWGSDVYSFPYESRFNRATIRKNLESADLVGSTSHAMKRQAELLFDPKHEIPVTPFGVDCDAFRPEPKKPFDGVTLGTVKTLSPVYGIDTLIHTFYEVVKRYSGRVRLVIVGGGPQERELRRLVERLGLREKVEFIGAVNYAEVPQWLNQFDVYYALSEAESFGVAVVEASACGVPVIVSNVGGLPEVVQDGITGFVVPRGDPMAAADRTMELLSQPEFAKAMGAAGRALALQKYDWIQNADWMEKTYNDLVSGYGARK